MIVADGVGRRAVKNVETEGDRTSESRKSSPGSSNKADLMDLWAETLATDQPQIQRPVLLLADSLGRCIPQTDSVIRPIVKDTYQFDTMAQDIASGLVSLDHKYVIIWAGAHQVGTAVAEQMMVDLKALVNIIRVKNRNIQIFISSIIPQPRDQRNLQSKIATINNEMKMMVAEYKQVKFQISFLQSHLIYLDEKLDIIRPIVDNFEDGFHLNLHGAHRIRQFWLNEIGVNK